MVYVSKWHLVSPLDFHVLLVEVSSIFGGVTSAFFAFLSLCERREKIKDWDKDKYKENRLQITDGK